MEDHFTHIFILIASIVLWIYCSAPFLRYTIDAAEGRFKWKFILWFALIIGAIFLMKYALHNLTGFPATGTWMSRLFFGVMLFLSLPIPFIHEFIRSRFKR